MGCAYPEVPLGSDWVRVVWRRRSWPRATFALIDRTGEPPATAAAVQNAPSRLVKPSPTSIEPSIVSASTFAAVLDGIEIDTEETPVESFTSAARTRLPPKSKL